MATSLGLALQISANASGLEAGLSKADKALAGFASQLNGVGKQFDSFANTAGQLPASMQGVADEATRLGQSFREGAISQEQLVAGLRNVKDSAAGLVDTFKFGEQVTAQYTSETTILAEKQAQLDKAFEAGAISSKTYAQATADIASQQERLSPAFAKSQAALAAQNAELEEANRVTAQLATAEENYASEVQNLEKLLAKGYITQETFNRGIDKAAKSLPATTAALERQAQAQKKRDAELSRAAQITSAAATNEEKYAQETKELEKYLAKGLITQTTFNRSLDSAKSKFGQVAKTAKQTGVQFNELSGMFGLLPGPLGAAAARISSFSSALGGLGKIFKGGSLNFGGLINQFKGLLTRTNLAAAGIVAFGAAVVGIAKGLNALETKIELTDRAARLLGSSFQFAQGIQVAVERVGRSFTEVQEPIARFQGQLQLAREGNETAARGFKLAGLSLEDLQTKAAPELFEELAEKFSKIEDPAKRAAAEIAVFGEQGPKLRDVFDGIAKAKEDVERLGAALTEANQADFKQFGQSVDELKVATDGLGQQILTPFVNAGKAITRGLTTLAAGFGQFAGTVLDFLSPVFTGLGIIVQQVFAGIGNTLNFVSALLEPFAMYGRMIGQAWSKVSDIFQSYNNTVTDLSNSIRKFYQNVYDYTEEIGAAFQVVYDYGERIVNIGIAIGQKFVTAIKNGATAVVEFVQSSTVLNGIANTIGSAFNAIGKGITYVADKIAESAGAVFDYLDSWLEWGESVLGIERKIKIEPEIVADLSEFEATMTKSLEDVAGLGSDGLEIRLEFTKTMEELSIALQKGEITAAEMAAQVKGAQENFDEQVKAAKKVNEELAKQVENEQKIIADLEKQQIIDQQFGGDSGRFKASENILAIENEIARVENEIFEAQLRGDTAAADAGTKRLANLDQLKAKEDDIASGRVAAEKEAAKERKKLAEASGKALEESLKNAVDIATPSTEALKAVDANSEAGIAEAFRLANGDDPAQKTELKQLKALEEIRDELKNQPTEVLIGS